jgi:DNA processing protein
MGIVSARKTDILEKVEKRMKENGLQFLSVFQPGYPALLKEVNDAPLGLYIKGTLPGDNFINISIIGSRNCSEYGRTAAFQLSRDLAEKGVTVVSGMARGIDSMAHRGALAAKGKTIAVLGHGLDLCYPPENERLMAEIVESGCVLSEYPPGVKPFAANFPARNRIISGLSHGLVVVEAGERSGTGITVEQALDQGREIFAVPGNIFSKLSVGVNKLIKDGACPVLGYADILEGLGVDAAAITKAPEKTGQTAAPAKTVGTVSEKKEPPLLTAEEKMIYDCIGFEPVSADEISLRANQSMQITLFCLTTLELNRCVKRLPGQRYSRVF